MSRARNVQIGRRRHSDGGSRGGSRRATDNRNLLGLGGAEDLVVELAERQDENIVDHGTDNGVAEIVPVLEDEENDTAEDAKENEGDSEREFHLS